METVLDRAPESIKFGLKSIKKHAKTLILQGFLRSGRRSRKFESCHLDQKAKGTARRSFCFFSWCVNSTWLRSNCKFAYPARRSASSLARRRARISRSGVQLPCHLDQLECSQRIYEHSFSVQVRYEHSHHLNQVRTFKVRILRVLARPNKNAEKDTRNCEISAFLLFFASVYPFQFHIYKFLSKRVYFPRVFALSSGGLFYFH